VAQDVHGHGLEWFSVWHRVTTVFDVAAQVSTGPLGIPQGEVQQLRSLVRDLDPAVARITDHAQ
jgi:GntR family transcriptional regulator